MSIGWLDRSEGAIAEAFARRLAGRTSSVFRVLGEEASRAYADTALAALRTDLLSGKREAVRASVAALVEELSSKGLTFADLRFYAQTLRSLALAAIEEASAGDVARRQLDEWCIELVLVSATRFMAQREDLLQERAAQREVNQLESQLGELKAALEEKSRLLEVIREASTPIAPVVEGILIVPLVGVFDAFRAESLTDKLLQEVSRSRARVVILDITGVPVFDADAAQLIIRLAQAIRLLGTEMLVVGVSPRMARTIVELGVDLAGLRTLGTLQDGLAQALVVRGLKITRL